MMVKAVNLVMTDATVALGITTLIVLSARMVTFQCKIRIYVGLVSAVSLHVRITVASTTTHLLLIDASVSQYVIFS